MRAIVSCWCALFLACQTAAVDQRAADFTESDDELALRALQILGARIDGASPHACANCHQVSREQVLAWFSATAAAQQQCMPKKTRRFLYRPRAGQGPNTDLAELHPTCTTQEEVQAGNCYWDPSSELMTQEQALGLVNCFRSNPADGTSPFRSERAGLFAIEAHERNSHFKRLFEKAYPDPVAANAERTHFVHAVKMPRGSFFIDQLPASVGTDYTTTIRKEDFWVVLEWFDRNLAGLDRWMPEERPPETCETTITSELQQYVTTQARGGWTMKNALNSVAMFGCDSDTVGGWPNTAIACFADKPQATEVEAVYTGVTLGAKVRKLHQLDFTTSFWTRSSADGRFVANGGGLQLGAGSTVTDLQKGINIPIVAAYDPGFTADNLTFMFQGTPVGAGFCPQDLLLNPPAENGTLKPIAFSENGCGGSHSIPLYQHLGTALDGNVSYAIVGHMNSDDAANQFNTRPQGSTAGAGANASIVPIVRHGIGYEFLPPSHVSTTFESDTVISPTSRLVSARLAGPRRTQLGYTIRLTQFTQEGGQYRFGLGEPSTVCAQGGKTAHSYDDRFIAYHTYKDTPGGGSGDIDIVDLANGAIYPVTTNKPGTWAVFPHFRSDGWLYFLVRNRNDPYAYVAASDIALVIEKANPINAVSW